MDPGDPGDARGRAARIPAVVRRRLAPFDARLERHSWIAAFLVTGIAAIIRLVGLTHPRGKIFDELYYAAEAQSLLRYGVEWDLENNTPKYVVHPPLGKWCIALGEKIFGYNELGWRIMPAMAGIFSVLIITRIARRMFGSTVLGCAAGLLMALDGLHFVLSRTALLDIFLMFFLLAAFGCLVIDRDQRRRRWLALIASGADPSRPGRANRPVFTLRSGGWRSSVPWWRLAAGVLTGCAFAVKWSALFYVPMFVLLIVVWEAGARRSAGVRRPWRDTLLDETGWVVLYLATILMVYMTSWVGWFSTDDGYLRHWIASQGGTEPPVIGAMLNLWHYHAEALNFHDHLQSPHPYQSWPWQWLLLGRPVAFYWTSNGPCGASSCAGEVLLLGTPVLWWSFIVVLPLLIWFGIARRDWRMPPIALGIAAGILPWIPYAFDKRTMFYFYVLPAEPFLILATVFVLGAVMSPAPGTRASPATADRRMVGAIVAGGYVLAVGLCFLYFYPVYTGQVLSYAQWHARMWLEGRWI
ncbi:MAG TPA: phospholipid carrier-dependent glycosyltransferase [Micromonosporaceae bacterium]|nr:phospholipid carrier-dependent glycosyltransferase [Micromonosporaceae bacterium]